MAVTIDGNLGVTSPDFEPSSSTVPTNGLFLPTTNALGFATNSTERLRLDASGNLGIGTTSPGGRLDVSGGYSYFYGLRISGNDTGNTIYQNAAIGISSGNYITFSTNASGPYERARIDSSGNLLVGTTDSSPTSGEGIKFVKNRGGSSGYNAVSVFSTASSVGYSTYELYTSSGGAGYKFYVAYNGTISAVSTTISGISDQRLKENIRDLDDGLATILALKPRKFDWKEGKGKDIKDDRGFIAQEFEQVFPDLIDTWKDPAPEGEEPYKSVRPDLIPVMVKAIQELTARLEALENK